MIYTIKNDKTEVKINSLGAEVRSVVHNGKERTWQNETEEWSGCAILLFPFAGFNRLVYDGVDFGIQKHGFCRNEEFELTALFKRLYEDNVLGRITNKQFRLNARKQSRNQHKTTHKTV